MTDEPTSDESAAKLHVEGVGNSQTAALDKADSTTQLPKRRIQSLDIGIQPPYNPDRLAAFLELNETHAAAVRKKSRYEVGFGFDIVPTNTVDPEEASDEERELVEDFWRGEDSTWQTGPQQSAEPATPPEVLELARQDYHSVGWLCLEILTDMEGTPVGLAHVPANTVRVRKPPRDSGDGDGDGDGRAISHSAPEEYEARGYVQRRGGRTRYFGEAGDRHRGQGDTDKDPVFVDAQTGDVTTGSAERLENEPANELIYVRNPSPLEQDYGVPDWVSAIRTISADEAAKDYNRAFFDNDTIPRFVIKVTGGELTEESRRDLKQMLHGLREESHRAVILEVEKFANQLDTDVEIELEPIGQGISEEMDFREFRAKNEHEIAKVHEVPPILIGVTETSNRANSKEQVQDFARNVIAPEQHKFATRLYQILHQTALDVSDWTIEFELRGADQPKEDAEVARRKIAAVRGAVPVNRALEMVGEDPLPEDHPVDGDTLVSQVGQDPRGDSPEASVDAVSMHAPPEENKIGERDWADVEADLASKDPLEQVQFNSSNLDEGLYDFGEQELYLSFEREEGQSSLYAYVNVPPSEWSGLANASSAGGYHYDSIRLEYPYIEVTNFHDRLPEGPSPDAEDVPDDIPLS